MTFLRAVTVLVAEEPSNSTSRQGRVNDFPFEYYIYPSALVIISFPSPTFHYMFT